MHSTDTNDTPSCDVWHGDTGNPYECNNLTDMKREMRRLRKEGKEGIRAYAEYLDGRRFVYFFGSDGSIRKDDNNLTN